MARVPLTGGAYQARSLIAAAQKCVNLFPENNPEPDSQSPVRTTHYPTPGLRFLGRPSDQPGTPDPIPVPPFTATGVHFDGSTFISTPSLTATDDQFLSFSLWFNDTNPSPNYWTHWVVDPASGYISNDEVFTDAAYGIVVADAAFSNVLRDKSAVSAVTYGTWHNVLCSVNVNFAAGLKIHNLYLDGVEISSLIQDVDAAFVMAWNGLPFFINSDTNFTTIGDLAEFWFAPGQFIDFTIAANRQKFLSAGGQPVDLGADGSTPTGTAPAIYLSRRTGDLPAAFATNHGTGGAFAVTGALTASATNPSL